MATKSSKAMKLRKGDQVRVLQGKDRGKEGEIMRALPAEGKVVVDRVNTAKKHQRATRTTMQGGIIDKDMPIAVSAVAILCPSCGRPTRIGYRFGDPNNRRSKVRICRKCGGEL
jgi:large subunit ribosomal protein L24